MSAIGGLLLLATACGSDVTSITPIVVDGEVFIGAGDIAWCGDDGDERTAALVESLLQIYPDVKVFTAGDNVYEDGTAQEYADCYEPTWGRFKERTWATIGDHEYQLGNADPTFDYFGSHVGPRGLGYYSFELGDWHVVMLNSNELHVPVDVGSAQEQWLRADLAANAKACVIAVFHHPRFSSCTQGEIDGGRCTLAKDFLGPLWDALYEQGADIVVNGDKHWYERFTPMDPDGDADPVGGIRQFVVGTGGKSVSLPSQIHPMSEVQNTDRSSFGVLKLILQQDTYSWEFVPISGETFTDSGTGVCRMPSPSGTVAGPAGR